MIRSTTPLMLIVLFAAGLFGQQTVFRSGVTLVNVDVEVSGPDGGTISGLTRQDFIVFDEDQHQSITHFGQGSEQLDLLLLLDVSDSMAQSVRQLASGAGRALSQLHPGDRVALMLFGPRARVFQVFTSDIEAAQQVIMRSHRQRMGIGTSINESLLAAAEYMKQQLVQGRRAIVIFTDNDGINHKSPDEDVVRAMFSADAVLHALVVPMRSQLPADEMGPGYTRADVRAISERTGGSALDGRGNIAEMFRRTIERIRSRYFLQYVAPQTEPRHFHRVRVELSPEAQRQHPKVVIRARAGYFPAP